MVVGGTTMRKTKEREMGERELLGERERAAKTNGKQPKAVLKGN